MFPIGFSRLGARNLAPLPNPSSAVYGETLQFGDSYLTLLALTGPVAIINRNSLPSHIVYRVSHGYD